MTGSGDARPPGGLHHLELWVADHDAALGPWSWLLGRLGYVCTASWPGGSRWAPSGPPGAPYLVLESGPDVLPVPHERRRPGLNHVALWAGAREDVDDLVRAAPDHGWRPLFVDRYPHAGGPDHYAAYLEDDDGFEVEVVADSRPATD